MGGLVSLLPYVGVDELQGKVVEVAKCLTAEFLGTMFLVLVTILLVLETIFLVLVTIELLTFFVFFNCEHL